MACKSLAIRHQPGLDRADSDAKGHVRVGTRQILVDEAWGAGIVVQIEQHDPRGMSSRAVVSHQTRDEVLAALAPVCSTDRRAHMGDDAPEDRVIQEALHGAVYDDSHGG